MSFVFDGGFAAEAGVDAAVVAEAFNPGGDPGVDLVTGCEGTPVVVIDFIRSPNGFGHGVIPGHSDLPIDTVRFTVHM